MKVLLYFSTMIPEGNRQSKGFVQTRHAEECELQHGIQVRVQQSDLWSKDTQTRKLHSNQYLCLIWKSSRIDLKNKISFSSYSTFRMPFLSFLSLPLETVCCFRSQPTSTPLTCLRIKDFFIFHFCVNKKKIDENPF